MSETMLVLNLNPELEEDLVDYLLSLPFITGFTSYSVDGHGTHDEMTIAEQVSGRRGRLQVEVILEQDAVTKVLAGLKESVGRDIAFWQQQVLGRGYID